MEVCNLMMPKIGTEVNMTYDQFKEMNILLFGRHGNLEIDVYAEMDREMHLVHLDLFMDSLKLFTSEPDIDKTGAIIQMDKAIKC